MTVANARIGGSALTSTADEFDRCFARAQDLLPIAGTAEFFKCLSLEWRLSVRRGQCLIDAMLQPKQDGYGDI